MHVQDAVAQRQTYGHKSMHHTSHYHSSYSVAVWVRLDSECTEIRVLCSFVKTSFTYVNVLYSCALK